MEKEVFALKLTESKNVIGISRTSITKQNTNEMSIRGVNLSSYIYSPFKIDQPIEFLKEATERLLGSDRKNHGNLVLILKSMINLARDESGLDSP